MFPGTKNRNEGTCGCSPAPNTGPRTHSPKLPFYPPILAFFVFLAFFVLRFSLLFCAFLLSFPRISRVLQGGKSSLFSGHPRFFFCQKSRDWRVRVPFYETALLFSSRPAYNIPCWLNSLKTFSALLLRENLGFVRRRPPGPHPRTCLALPSSGCRCGIDSRSIRH